MAELVEIIPVDRQQRRWEPIVGNETLALLEHFALPEESSDRLTDEALRVLSLCAPPQGEAAEETGLAVGYVQSGKTMSFTTVAALARDNGYALVILIAGTSLPLLRQSTTRLQKDLRLTTRQDRKWLHIESEAVSSNLAQASLRDAIEDWCDPRVPKSLKRTLLITTMKHHGHLKKVTKALQRLDLRGLPALVIDDEADQASLNAAVLKRSETTTYRRIKALREALPHHSYVQYTATPQAPLLINIIDTLSPRFAEVLTPGPDYVGGKHFFLDHEEFVKVIHDDELPDEDSAAPPESLMRAMRLFFVGVAVGILQDESRGNRSMMIHPSQRRSGHSEYFGWASAISREWQSLLDPDGRYPEDREELLDEFREAHADLASTAPDLPSFEEVVQVLHFAIRRTVIEEINAASGTTPEIRWQDHYSWILVGGQAMDRGFTVEGLTVTYMPRGIGVGNADTIQQRARFFGYKRPYLGYCRIFLENAAYDAYVRYVEHEEDVRRRLIQHRDTGAPLSEWKRAFLLDQKLRPTRQSVLDLAYRRASTEGNWYIIKRPYESEIVAVNRQVVGEFLSSLELRPDAGHRRRSEFQVHDIAEGVSVRVLLEGLLSTMRVADPADSQEMMLLQVLLRERLEHDPSLTCTIYDMSRGELRERTLNQKGEVLPLFQGAAPSEPQGNTAVGDVYPGDRELAKQRGGLVIQIHHLVVKKDGATLSRNVPTIAVYVPSELSRNLLVQEQPAQAGS